MAVRVPDPCCGMALEKGTKILAIIQIIFSAIGAIVGVFAIFGFIALQKEHEKQHPEDQNVYIALIAISGIMAIANIFELLLSIILLIGANQRNLAKCRVWLIITIILVVIWTVGIISNLAGGNTTASSTSSSVISLIFRGYMIWVVYAFITELKGGA